MADKTIKPYVPASKNPFSFEVSTPANMAFEMKQALSKLKRMYGDVDKFVQSKLGYANVQELYKNLGAEQIDGVALTIHQIEQGNGLIIGDQTGIGKGRQAAAIIRYSIVNGFKCVFITEKSNLFSDLYRDLMDIGYPEAVPFLFNNDSEANLVVEVGEGEDKQVVKMQDYTGNLAYSTKTNAAQARLIGGKSELPEGYDFVMTTYSQLSADNVAKKARADENRWLKFKPSKNAQFKTQFLREYAPNSIFIMDEAHNAGGAVSNIGYYLREILATSKGCCYLSATYAKRSDNLPIYGIKTSIKDAKLKSEDLIATFSRGGVAMQEIVASDLVKAGQMIRRQRTFDGIKVAYNYLEDKYEKHVLVFDKISAIVRDIIQFQRDHISGIIREMDKALRGDGGGASGRKGTAQAGVNNVEYFNKIHNVIRQLLFSIKAYDVAKETVKLLKLNKKVVIAFSSTMGSFLESEGYSDGDIVEHQDFALILNRGLEGVLKYTRTTAEGEKVKESIPIQDLPIQTQIDYKAIHAKIQKATTGISISPIDILINYIEAQPRPTSIGGVSAAYFRVRECTGRKAQIKVEDGLAIYRSFRANKKAFFRQFNNGTADVLLINQSASTGVSCHASAKFKDQRKRVMIIHQAELNINTEIQKRGRINRTGQVTVLDGKDNMPEYLYISTSIPAEQRLFMVLKQKLKSLDANTTGSQRSSEGQLKVEDFFNKYGAKVIEDYLKQDFTLNTKLGDPLKFNEEEKSVATADIPKRVTNAISIHPVALQKKFYKAIMSRYTDLVNDLKMAGEYDLEVDFLDYQAESLGRNIFVPGPGGTSPFAKSAYIETAKVKVLRKPLKFSAIQSAVEKYLEGEDAMNVQKRMLDEMEKKYEFYTNFEIKGVKLKIQNFEEEIELLKDDLAREQSKPIPEEEKLATKLQKAIEKIEKKIKTRENKKNEFEEKLAARQAKIIANKENLKRFLSFLNAGKPVVVPFQDGDSTTVLKGVVLRVVVDKDATNPYAPSNVSTEIAVNSALRIRKIKLSDFPSFSSMENETDRANQRLLEEILTDWNRLSAIGNSQTVEMITGNTLLGMAHGIKDESVSSVRLIKFTTNKGEILPGIRMGVKDKGQLTTKLPINHPTAIELIKQLSFSGKDSELLLNDGRKDGLKFKKYAQGIFALNMPGTGAYAEYFKNPLLPKWIMPTPEERLQGKLGSFKSEPPNKLEGKIHQSNLQIFCDYLYDKWGLTVASDIVLKAEEEPEEAIPDRASSNMVYWYELQEPYKASEYPIDGFVGMEPQVGLYYGKIGYSKPLNARQRYLNGLIPIYDSVKVPFELWLNAERSVLIEEELRKEVIISKTTGYAQSIKILGNFIFNYPHEEGNPEFVFGRYEPIEFGKLLYEKEHGESLQKFVEMFAFEMAA